MQNPVDHLCVVYSPLCQIKHCFQDLRNKVNESEVHDFFEILMVYTYPETPIPSKYKHFNYRQSLLNDENSVLTQLVIRELLLLIDWMQDNTIFVNKDKWNCTTVDITMFSQVVNYFRNISNFNLWKNNTHQFHRDGIMLYL